MVPPVRATPTDAANFGRGDQEMTRPDTSATGPTGGGTQANVVVVVAVVEVVAVVVVGVVDVVAVVSVVCDVGVVTGALDNTVEMWRVPNFAVVAGVITQA